MLSPSPYDHPEVERREPSAARRRDALWTARPEVATRLYVTSSLRQPSATAAAAAQVRRSRDIVMRQVLVTSSTNCVTS